MASTPKAPAPSSTIPESGPKISSEDIISQKTDLCISNAIVKTGIGFSSGVILSVLLFKRRSFPVWLGTGFGLGSGWTDCERSFNPVAIPGVRILPSPHHQAAPSSGTPSVLERLSSKTSDLIDAGKSKSSELIDVGKGKSSEVIEAGKEKANEVVEKGKGKAKEVEEKVRRI
ncbi:hypothetical protein CBS101457_005259 [Exobasidium rhododendri]|nr:hypothetical protein CBS101457_005259 [Exobasidium rhododendri]